MFNFRLYSVYDSKADSFSQPMVRVNDNVAIRDFGIVVNDKRSENAISVHPEDYTLFCVGEWSSSEGKLSGISPMSVVNAVQLVKASD